MNKYKELVAQINMELDAALGSPNQGEFNNGCIFAYRSLLTKVDKLDNAEQISVVNDMIKGGAKAEEILTYLGVLKQPIDILFPEKVVRVSEPEVSVVEVAKKDLVNSEELASLVGVTAQCINLWARSGMPYVMSDTKPQKRLFDVGATIDWIHENKPKYEQRSDTNKASKQRVKQEKVFTDIWTEEYMEWRRNIIELIKSYGFKNVNDILRWTYNELTRDYGIVWDQERKAYKEKFGYPATSTMQLAYELDRLAPTKKLFEAKLVTVCERNKED